MTDVWRWTSIAAASYACLGTWGMALAHNAEVDEAPPITEITITARPVAQRSLLEPAQQLSGAALAQRQGSTLGENAGQLTRHCQQFIWPQCGRP